MCLSMFRDVGFISYFEVDVCHLHTLSSLMAVYVVHCDRLFKQQFKKHPKSLIMY